MIVCKRSERMLPSKLVIVAVLRAAHAWEGRHASLLKFVFLDSVVRRLKSSFRSPRSQCDE